MLAKLENDSFDYSLLDIHHKNKIDSPSGTALMLKEILSKNNLTINSIRSGTYPGTHSLYLDAKNENIEITHTARSRTVFCDGAILSAKFLLKQTKSGRYCFNDVLGG